MPKREIDEVATDIERRRKLRRARLVAPDVVGNTEVLRNSSNQPGLVSDAEQLRLLTEAADDCAIISLDQSGRVTSWNDGARRVKRYEASEVIGRHFALFYTLDDIKHGKAQAELAAAREAGRFQEEAWRVRKGGEQFWARVALTAIHDTAGNLRGFTKVTRDLTLRERARAAEKRLQETQSLVEAADSSRREAQAAERRLLALIETMSDAYFTLDEQWRFEYVNASLARVLGKSREDLLGASFWDEVTDSVHSNFFTHLPSLLTGTPQVAFTELHAPTARWFAVRANRSEGRIAVMLRDVTAEQQNSNDSRAAEADSSRPATDSVRGD
jgi:PAS domain S-box-containing protein